MNPVFFLGVIYRQHLSCNISCKKIGDLKITRNIPPRVLSGSYAVLPEFSFKKWSIEISIKMAVA